MHSNWPLIQTYVAAVTANMSKNSIKPNVSKLFAVTRFTPNRIVLNNFPCDVENPVRNTYATHPLSVAENDNKINISDLLI